MLKNFLSFTRSEQYGILALMILVLLLILTRILLPYFVKEPDVSELIKDVTKIATIENENSNIENKLVLKEFNPNKITKEQLISYGLPNNVSENWIKYIEKGGVFYKKEDVQKIYGVTDELYNYISPYLIIENNFQNNIKADIPLEVKSQYIDLNRVDPSELYKLLSNEELVDSLITSKNKYWFSKKILLDELKEWSVDTLEKVKLTLKPKFDNKKDILVSIDINLADTTEWMQFYGVGPVLSSRIVNYRKKLGGFVYHEQLLEVYGVNIELYEKMKDYLLIEASIERKININKASVYQLRQHPYINFYTAKAIVDKRFELGGFTSVEEINLVEIFEKEQWISISPYFYVE